QSLQNYCKIFALGIEYGKMIEPRSSHGCGSGVLAMPGIESDVMMITTCGNKHGLVTIELLHFETKQVAIEWQRSVDVCNLQVNVPDSCARRNGVAHKKCLLQADRGQLSSDHPVRKISYLYTLKVGTIRQINTISFFLDSNLDLLNH